MTYRINYEEEYDYIAVAVDGAFSLSTLKELAADVSKLIEKHGCNRIMNDMRHAKLTKGTIDIYQMPQAANQAGVTVQCKRALVVSEQSSDFYFLETVFVNQGHTVKLFTDINEALHWLLDSGEI